MDGFQNLFLRKLRERIMAEISERETVLVNGKAVDFTDYRVKVEAIHTLKFVSDTLFEQVAEELLDEQRTPRQRRS